MQDFCIHISNLFFHFGYFFFSWTYISFQFFDFIIQDKFEFLKLLGLLLQFVNSSALLEISKYSHTTNINLISDGLISFLYFFRMTFTLFLQLFISFLNLLNVLQDFF